MYVFACNCKYRRGRQPNLQQLPAHAEHSFKSAASISVSNNGSSNNNYNVFKNVLIEHVVETSFILWPVEVYSFFIIVGKTRSDNYRLSPTIAATRLAASTSKFITTNTNYYIIIASIQRGIIAKDAFIRDRIPTSIL